MSVMFSKAQMPVGTARPGSGVACPRIRARLAFAGVVRQAPYCQQREVLTRASGPAPLTYVEGYKEVEEVAGARLAVDGPTPRVEYLIKWKVGSDDVDPTWEVAADLSEDLVRDFEEKWWTAARKADIDTLIKMLGGARELLANVVNEDKRSALHFAAALGNVEATKLMVEAGADVNLQDREGYTPLHMAAGYMHTGPMTVLLEAGANPEIKDNNGRCVVTLIDNLRASMPLSMGSVQRRLALEEVSNCLTDRLYDEVEPSNILNVRTLEAPAPGPDGIVQQPTREFLVSFPDGRDDEWVPERNVGAELVEDWEAGLEFATAQAVLDVAQVGLERRFKVQWSDGYPTSWEPEEHVPPELIALFAQQNPELFSERTSLEAGASGRAGSWEALGVTDGVAGQGEAGAEGEEAYYTQSSKVYSGNGRAAAAAGEAAAAAAGAQRPGGQQREAVGAAR